MKSVCFIVASLGFAASCLAQGVYGYDLHGQPVRRLATPGSQVVLFFFLATDCPISNRYVPEIRRLANEFSGRRVDLWLVYPNATETAAAVTQHQTSFGLALPTLIYPDRQWIAATHATITPEAVVMVPGKSPGPFDLRTVYSGRIDNRYVDIGRERPRATRHDLEDAVAAALAHQPVAAPGGPPVGCGIIPESALGRQ